MGTLPNPLSKPNAIELKHIGDEGIGRAWDIYLFYSPPEGEAKASSRLSEILNL